MELDHLKQTFIEINNYPEQVVRKIITQLVNEEIERNNNEDAAGEINDDVNLQITPFHTQEWKENQWPKLWESP